MAATQRTQFPLPPYHTTIPVMHTPAEASAPPVFWASASGLDIPNSSLSAYHPPRGAWFNDAGTYMLDFPSPADALFVASATVTVTAGEFNNSVVRVRTEAGAELTSTTAAYFRW